MLLALLFSTLVSYFFEKLDIVPDFCKNDALSWFDGAGDNPISRLASSSKYEKFFETLLSYVPELTERERCFIANPQFEHLYELHFTPNAQSALLFCLVASDIVASLGHEQQKTSFDHPYQEYAK